MEDNSSSWRECSVTLDLAQKAFRAIGWATEDVVEGLSHAAYGGKLDVLKWIWETAEESENVPILNLVNRTSGLFGLSPVALAAGEGHLEVVQWLVHNGAKLDGKYRGGRNELLEAASGGHLLVVKWLLEKGVCVDAKDDDGETALHEAARWGHLTTVQTLVGNGASVIEQNSFGETAMDVAASSGNFGVVQRLAEAARQKIDATTWRNTPLFRAISEHKIQFVEFFLRECIVESRSEFWSSLFDAATRMQVDVIEYLDSELEIGLFSSTSNCRSALHEAAKVGATHVIDFLLVHGVDVSPVDGSGVTPAMEACRRGHLDVLLQFIKARADITIADATGQTALHFACKGGHASVVKALLDHGVDAIYCDQNSWTPLHCAAAVGDVDIVKLLVEKGARLEAVTDSDETPLIIAQKHGDVDLIQYLMEQEKFNRTRVSTETQPTAHQEQFSSEEVDKVSASLRNHDCVDTTVLTDQHRKEECAFLTSVDVVCRNFFQVTDHPRVVRLIEYFINYSQRPSITQHLAQSDWNPNEPTEGLFTAAFRDELERVERLCTVAEDPNFPASEKDGNQQTVLHWAVRAQKPNLALVRFLVDRNVRVADVDKWGNTALFYATVELKFEVVEFFLKECPRDKKSLDDLRKILFVAAKAGRVDLLGYLKNHNRISVRFVDSHRRSALHEAAVGGALECAKLLLNNRADVHQTDDFGVTPIIEASRHGRVQVLSLLLDSKGNVNDVDVGGRTPLHYAAEGGHVEIVDMLLERGVDVACSDKFGWTPMHCAAAAGCREVVKILMATDADVDIQTISGKTAASLSVERGHFELADLFRTEVNDGDFNVKSLDNFHGYTINPNDLELSGGTNYWLGVPVETKAKHLTHTNFVEELDRWSRLNHPNVVQLYGVCRGENNETRFVSELAKQGSLSRNLAVSPIILWERLYGAALGLQYLHESNMIHGQLSCDSIVIADDGLTQLRNFGFDHTKRLEWTAPEVLLGMPLSFESDIYAFGITIAEAFMNGSSPWGLAGYVLEDAILSGKLPDKSSQITASQWMLIERMCYYNPRERPSAGEIVRKLKRLCDETSAPSDFSGSNKSVQSWYNLSDAVVASTTVSSLLAEIKEMCQDSNEANDMFRGVFERLDSMLESLNKRYRNMSGDIVHRYCIILLYLHRRLSTLTVVHSNSEARFAADRQLLVEVFALHKDIDLLMSLIELTLEDTVHVWRQKWEAHRNQQVNAFLKSLRDAKRPGGSVKKQNEDDLVYARCELHKVPRNFLMSDEGGVSEAKRLLASQWTKMVSKWFIPEYDVELDNLGQFSSGQVGSTYCGKWNQAQVLVEKIGTDFQTEALACYVETWYKLHHPHVVKLFGACHVRQPFLVCEYTNEQLDQHLLSHPNKVCEKLYEAALGLRYLHAKQVIHGNLNDTSIVLGIDGCVKLTKFCLNISHLRTDEFNEEPESEKDSGVKMSISHAQWHSPEVLDGQKATEFSDIYSFGKFILHVINVTAASQITHFEQQLRDVVALMCCANPLGRPSASEVVRRLEVFTDEYRQRKLQSGELDMMPLCWSTLGGFRICSRNSTVTVSSLLAEISDNYTATVVTRDVYERLVDIFSQLKSKWGKPSQHLVEQFVSILQTIHTNCESWRQLDCQDHMYTASIHRNLDSFMNYTLMSRSGSLHQRGGQLELPPVEEHQDQMAFGLHSILQGDQKENESSWTSSSVGLSAAGLSTSLEEDYSSTESVVPSLTESKYENWFIPEYEIAFVDTNVFSRGGFGKVFYGTWRRANVVVKTVELKTEKQQLAFLNEVKIWHKLSHPHVVQLFGACHVQRPFFVCENAKGGQLDQYLKIHPGEVWNKLYEAAVGLQYLHEMGVIHGDLKCNNILIGADGLAKLTDFGLSRMLLDGSVESFVPGSSAAIRWKAPEVLRGDKVTFASDIYSFGMCILEATSRAYPWGGTLEVGSVKHHVLHLRKIPMRPLNCSETMYRQVERMCAFDSDDRISAADVVRRLEVFTQLFVESEKGTAALAKLDEMPKVWVNLDDAVVITSSFGSTVSYLLASIEEMCQGSTVMDTMNREVFNRLAVVFSQLKTQQSTLTHDIIQKYGDILHFFNSQLEKKRGDHLSGASFIATTRLGIDTSLSVHRDVDMFVSMVHLSLSKSEREWRNQWELRRREQQHQVSNKLNSLLALLANMEDEENKSNILQLLRLELMMRPPSCALEYGSMGLTWHAVAASLTAATPDWFIPDYEVSKPEEFSRGGFGSVFLGEWKHVRVVVKAVGRDPFREFASFSFSPSASEDASSSIDDPQRHQHDDDMKYFLNEVQIWCQLRHPHVVQLYGACHIDKMFFVCEYAEHGTLNHYLRNHPEEVWKKLYEAALGLKYLHSKGVVHCDLKCNNILVGRDFRAKLADFGLSVFKGNSPEINPLAIGAIRWKAPEVLRGEKSSFASDIYSFGMCILEAGTGTYPWRVGISDEVVKYHVLRNKSLPSRPENFSDEEFTLVQRMCTFNPEERISINEVVKTLDALRQRANH